MATWNEPNAGTQRTGKRTRLVRPYPVNTLKDALEVAQAIAKATSGYPVDRAQLANALGTTVSSSAFTTRLNSSAKYGLTQGAYNDPVIRLTPTGEAITAPQAAAERHGALIEAALRPVLFRRFYEMFNGRQVPADEYARNLVQRELEVHPDLAGECLDIITANGAFVGILRTEADGTRIVDLGVRDPSGASSAEPAAPQAASEPRTEPPRVAATPVQQQSTEEPRAEGRIFVGHAGPSAALEAVRDTLTAFNIQFVDSDASSSGGLPVPADVAREMRSCTAGILIFGGADSDASSLGYQLGGASVLFGEKVVVLEEATGSDASDADHGLNRVTYRQNKPARLGLDLLKALAVTGVIKVTA